MCGAKEILLENVRGKGNPIEILEKTSQSEPHPSPRPRDPWKSWKKPHNLRTIPWTAGNPGKKPHNITDLLVGWLLVVGCCCSDKLCRGPLWGQI